MKLHRAQRFVDNFRFLEAPKWRDGRLYVSDVFDRSGLRDRHDVATDRSCARCRNARAGWAFFPDGRLIVASAMDRRLLAVDGDGTSVYADLGTHAAGPVNDFAIDAQGRIYVGNFGYDFHAGEPAKATPIHRVDPDGTITAVADGLEFPNGSVIIDDGRTLIVAETWVGRITAFDLDAEGRLSNRRVFADLGERQPDGLCADASGAIWAGCYNTGEFVRVLDGGTITDRLQFEGSAISCTLGGADGRTLFMTAYLGSGDEIAAGQRKSAVFTTAVEVPGPGAGRT